MSEWPNFKIPKDWALRPVIDIAEKLRAGGTPSRKNKSFYGDDIPFVLIEDMTRSGLYLNSTEEFLSKSGLDSSSAWMVPAGTILLSMYATIGETVVTRFPVATNQAILAIIPKAENNAEFLAFCLRAHKVPLAQRNVESTQKNINKGIVSTFLLPIPPLPEQKKIAHILSTVQQAIEEQGQIIRATTELKKALMQKLFVEGLHSEPQKQTDIGPIPESWRLVELKKTGDVVYGIQAAVANNLKPIGLKILTNKNINLEGGFNLEKINYFELKTPRHFATILQKGDILFNWRSGSKHHVGKTAYFDMEGEWVHSSFILRIRPKSEINGRYLFYYLNYLRESEYFIKLQTYAINAKFNKSAVNSIPTAVPERPDQDLIANTLDLAQEKVSLAEAKSRALQDLFRTLLHELMTVKIRVNDINFEGIESSETA